MAAALVAFPEIEGQRMPERSNAGAGFTDEDRKVLITVQVKMERLETDVREGLGRISKLEADRVTRKDVEDLLTVIEEKNEEHAHLAKMAAAAEIRIAELEKLIPQVEKLKGYAWLAAGALGFAELVLNWIFKK